MSSISREAMVAPGETDLPEGWVSTKLGDVICPSAERVEPNEQPSVPYISLEHIEANTTRILGHGSGADVTSTKAVFRAGDILYGRLRPYLNKVCIPLFDGICSTDILVFPRTLHLNQSYVLRFLSLHHVVEYATHNSSGVQLPRVSFGKLADLDFPLPPQEEQKRIATKVDAVLTRLARVMERLSRVPQILKRFRQSVLAAACSGRLTREWRTKGCSAPADEGTDLPHGWRRVALGEQFKIERGRFLARPRNDPRFYEGPYPFVQIGNLPKDGGSITENSQTLNEEGLKISRMFPKGTILIAIVGATIGNTGILSFDSCCPDSLVAVRTGSESEAKYVEYFLRIKKQEIRGASYASGGQPNINLQTLNPFLVPIPPHEEIREIVGRVEAIFRIADAIEARMAAATARAEKLAQAILAKAFRGELVPTEAELARREGRDYEPASVLLDRIQTNRAMAAGEQPKPRRERLAPLAEPRASAATPKLPARDRAVDVDHDHDDGESAIRPSRVSRHDRQGHSDGSDGTAAVPIGQTDRDDVMAVIRDVFATGGARTRDEAIHDIAEALGYGRVGSRIRDIFDDDIRTAVRRGILQNENGQLSLLVRQIDEYNRDHLVDMLLAGMGRTWWDRDEIIKMTTRWLGFRRTGPLIQKTLKATISTAIRRGLLESKGDAVRRL